MDFLTKFSLKNPTVVIVTAAIMLFGGLYTANELKRETMPDVSIPFITVVTPYPGAAPTDVHDKVSQPLERAVSGVTGLDTMQSYSADSVSVIVGQFGYSQDMAVAEAEIQQAIQDVSLPDETMDPTTARISFGSFPILKATVVGAGSAEELSALVQDEVLPALEALDGVGEVRTSEDEVGVLRIVFDAAELEDRGLVASDVIQQLQAANLSFPVGSVTIEGKEEPVRVSGTLGSIEDIKSFKVAIYPNMNEAFGEAFAQMGEGMGALGEGVGALGGAVGELGNAVGEIGAGVGDLGVAVGEIGAGVGELGVGVGELGEGMGELGEGLGTQIGLLTALQDVQVQLLDAKIALAEANAVLSNPASTLEEIEAAAATAAQLEATIPALEAAAAELDAQLTAVQEEAAKAASETAGPAVPSSTTPAIPTLPEGPTAPAEASPSPSASFPSAPASGDVAMEEPSIEIIELSEIAEVVYESGLGDTVARQNGEAAILVDIMKTQEANTVSVSDLVHEEVEALGETLPDDVSLEITYDTSDQINTSIDDMVREGLLGAFFAFLVILIFLRNWRSTLIAVISIPLSVVSALLVIGQLDITLNVMTLGGMTVAIGRVVDDSIVVIENIFRHLQIGEKRGMELIRTATREVSGAITSSTLTTVAVFAPMALVSGIVGKVFTPFAVTVAVALLASLLVSITIVPLIAKWALLGAKVPHRDEEKLHEGGLYARMLRWALGNRKAVVALAILLFVVSAALIPVVGTGFMPPTAEKFASVDVSYPPGTTAVTVDEGLRSLEDGLDEIEDIVYYQSTVGQNSGFSFGGGDNRGTVFIKFDEASDMDIVMDQVREVTLPMKNDDVSVSVSQTDVTGGGANSIEVLVTGPDFEDITHVAEDLAARMEGVEGLENVTNNLSDSRPQITVDVDQAGAAEYGLNAGIVAGTVRGFVADIPAGSVDLEGEDVDLVYTTDIGGVASASNIRTTEIFTPLGETVTIGEVAEVDEVDTPVSVAAYNERQYASVSASVTERDSSTVISDINAELADMDLPDGIEVKMAGMAEMMDESFQQLGLAMLIAIAAVYLVMVIAFGEAIAPLAIMFSLPLAIIGSIAALLMAGIPLDMPAMIGVLMLIGIVTTNAIVLIERVQQKLDEGLPRKEALIQAGADRIRPVLMTALTTIMALLPMASGFAEGALISQSLAITVVGGLTTSTILTLIVVPVIYDLLQGVKDKILGLEDGREVEAASA